MKPIYNEIIKYQVKQQDIVNKIVIPFNKELRLVEDIFLDYFLSTPEAREYINKYSQNAINNNISELTIKNNNINIARDFFKSNEVCLSLSFNYVKSYIRKYIRDSNKNINYIRSIVNTNIEDLLDYDLDTLNFNSEDVIEIHRALNDLCNKLLYNIDNNYVYLFKADANDLVLYAIGTYYCVAYRELIDKPILKFNKLNNNGKFNIEE